MAAAVDEVALGVAVDAEEAAAVAGDVDGECEEEASFEHFLIINLRAAGRQRCGREALRLGTKTQGTGLQILCLRD